MDKQLVNDPVPKAAQRAPSSRTDRFFLRHLGKDLLMLGALATVCLCVGLVIDQLRDYPLPLFYANKTERLERTLVRMDPNVVQIPTSAAKTADTAETNRPVVANAPRLVDLEEFQTFMQSPGAIVLDARPEIFHRLGHVPGALSLSREEFERDYARLRVVLEPARDRAVAVYCSSASCEDSQTVADALAKLGYHHVLVFKDGWSEWTHAGLPEEHS